MGGRDWAVRLSTLRASFSFQSPVSGIEPARTGKSPYLPAKQQTGLRRERSPAIGTARDKRAARHSSGGDGSGSGSGSKQL